uniref:Uncharacterized protein n=1 Tax=Chenopodium quinoa TaxID=63459 RepID=A0A803LQU5_CHEQI
MAPQLTKSLVFLAMTMFVMAYAVSGARNLVDLPVTVTVSADAGVVRASGTTKSPMNGCLNADGLAVEACGSMGPPIEGHVNTFLDGKLPGQN